MNCTKKEIYTQDINTQASLGRWKKISSPKTNFEKLSVEQKSKRRTCADVCHRLFKIYRNCILRRENYLRNKLDTFAVDILPASHQGNSCKKLCHEINTTSRVWKIERYSWLRTPHHHVKCNGIRSKLSTEA